MKHFITYLLLSIGQYAVMGMHPPREELALLDPESRVGYRDITLHSSSPARAVELLPVNGVSIDIPPSDDVSSYDKMILEYNAQHQIPPPEEGGIDAYPVERYERGIPITSEVAITRNRDIWDWDTNSDACCYIKCGCWMFGVLALFTLIILLSMYAHAREEHSTSVFIITRNKRPRRGF